MTDETVQACPECDTTHIQNVVGAKYAATTADHAWKCLEPGCRATFDEPTLREPEHSNHSRYGLAKRLLDADPDAVSAGNVGGGSA